MAFLEQLATRVIACTDCDCRTQARTLDQVPCGTRVHIHSFDETMTASTRRRLFDLGFMPGREVEVVRKAPLRDPVVYRVCDYDIALRKEQARGVRVGMACP